MRLNRIATISAFLLISLITYTQDFEEVYKAVASDRAIMDIFGYSVSISGNYAIVGAHYEDEDTAGGNSFGSAGSAYIFERDKMGNWSQAQKITASDRAIGDLFGFSVAISGSYCIVGAVYEDEDADSENTLDAAGSAYIFEKDEHGNWNQVQKIVASDRAANDEFGSSVSISGNYAIVGAIKEDEDTSGANTLDLAGSAYIFKRDEYGNWNQTQKIVASDRAPGDLFGYSVSISGNYALVGAWLEDEDAFGGNTLDYAGSAYIFECDGTGNWNQVQKIVASDRATFDYFSTSVSISGNFVLIGASDEDEDAEGENTLLGAGSAYIFERDSSGNWSEVQKIVASDRAEHDCFGVSAGISGNYILVGASSEDEDTGGGNTLADAGSAYIFKRDDSGNWNEVQKIVAHDRASEDYFGNSVSISGNYVLVGAYFEDEDASGGNTLDQAGSSYIFESCTPDNTSDTRNIIENAGFETCIFDPWVLYYAWDQNAMATYQLIDGTCIITPSHLASSPELWHIQLIQPFTAAQLSKLEAGEIYTLKFDAWAEEDNTECSVSLGMNEDPWTNALDEFIQLGTSKETFSFDFTLNEVYPSVKLSFNRGTETAWIGFDNISLIKKSELGFDENEINKTNIWPNPTNNFIQIIATQNSSICLYNSLGVFVKEITINSTPIQLDLSTLAKGVYLVEIRNGNTVVTQKVVIR